MTPELTRRIVSGLVMAIVVLGVTWTGGLPFRMLAAAISLLVSYEWSRITSLNQRNFTGNMTGWVGIILMSANIDFCNPAMSIPPLPGCAITVQLGIAMRGVTGGFPPGAVDRGRSRISSAAIGL